MTLNNGKKYGAMKTSKPVSVSVVLASILAASTAGELSASTCGGEAGASTSPSCCDQTSAAAPTPAGHDHGDAATAPSAAAPASQPAPAKAVQTVFENYIAVQSALARDSLANVSASAQALSAAARGDETKTFPEEIAQQADAVAKATSLARVRNAFKPLSEFLIGYLKVSSVPPGTYYEVYCPIAKASWMQTNETVKNPYLGPRSATPTWGWACAGVVKSKFESPAVKARTTDGGAEHTPKVEERT